jgi:aryl-alcohol dehydrogenase-like predicted oxidoreductase
MRYRRLGESGLVVSVVGIGCNQFHRKIDKAGTRAVVDAALEQGINFFDTADIYGGEPGGSEDLLGQALQGRRDEVVVATKFGMDMRGANGPDHGARGSRRYIMRAVEASLRRLRTDYIDLYQLHAPDPATPIEETLSALDDLVRAGKVRYIGHSNFSGYQTSDAAWTARTGHLTPFVSAQNHYSLLSRAVEKDLVPALEHYGLGLLPFFPLEAGLLTGKYHRGEGAPAGTRLADPRSAGRLAEANWDTIEALRDFAEKRDLSLLEVAIGGLAAKPAVTSVIAGATRPEQVAANAAAGAWIPTPEELAELNEIG